MKKSLLALAALSAIAGAASAQSSVTISGVIDVGLEKTTGTALQLTSSKMATSNITFKGVDDLGGGLKAGFTVSHEFNGDNGDSSVPSGGTGWGNFGSWVGLSGDFGSVDVGNVFTSTFKSHQTPNGTKGGSNSGAYTVLAFDGCDPAAAAAVTGQVGTPAQSNVTSCAHVFSRNTVQYNSPSVAGLSASLDVVFPEAGTPLPSHGHTVGLKYVMGPVDVRTAVERGLGKGKDLTLVSASLNTSFAKFFVNFENDHNRTTAKNSAYLVGARVPVGSAGSVWAHIGSKAEGGATVAGTVNDLSIFGLGYQHKLSARTSLYTNYGTYKNGNSLADKTDVGFGVAHSF